jgi:hypothetical protein
MNSDLEYECLGWEPIGGRRCLKMRIASRAARGEAPFQEHSYWVDLDRSGNPVRYEYRIRGDLWARAEDIELERFSLPAEEAIWLPVRGFFRSFVSSSQQARDGRIAATRKPTVEEDWRIVAGTVLINQGLPDRRFTVGWTAQPRTASLRAAHQEHDAIGPRSRARQGGSLVADLVNEADRQSRTLEASAPSSGWFSWFGVGAVAMPVFGLGCLVCAWVLKRRHA